MNTAYPVGTVVPELGDEHRDGTVFADAELALWSPCPEFFGGGWMVTARLPLLGHHTERRDAGTRVFGPYVAVMPPPTPQEDR